MVGNLNNLSDVLSRYKDRKKFVLVDENTSTHCLNKLIENVDYLEGTEILEIGAGENNKSLGIVGELSHAMLESHADRDSLLLCLGGGMITDLGGFLASVFKRGIDHVLIPTSLMAMIDASIGGKTSINLDTYKNQLGSFYNPVLTAIHPSFLDTLPKRHIINGLAEIIKMALISDEELWEEIERTDSIDAGFFDDSIILRAIELKKRIVEQDPYEKNIRKVLNFGHTLGHLYESLALGQNRDLLHGEAVASGIYYAIKLSEARLGFPKAERVYKLLEKHYKIEGIDIDISEFERYLIADKKTKNEEINLVLLEDVSKPIIDYRISVEELYAELL